MLPPAVTCLGRLHRPQLRTGQALPTPAARFRSSAARKKREPLCGPRLSCGSEGGSSPRPPAGHQGPGHGGDTTGPGDQHGDSWEEHRFLATTLAPSPNSGSQEPEGPAEGWPPCTWPRIQRRDPLSDQMALTTPPPVMPHDVPWPTSALTGRGARGEAASSVRLRGTYLQQPTGCSPEPLPHILGHPVLGSPPVQVARTHVISQLPWLSHRWAQEEAPHPRASDHQVPPLRAWG